MGKERHNFVFSGRAYRMPQPKCTPYERAVLLMALGPFDKTEMRMIPVCWRGFFRA